MVPRITKTVAAAAALIGLLVVTARPAAAQEASAGQARGKATRAAAPQPTPAVTSTEDPNAERTREQLMELLQKYPPSLGRVLKLDSSLLTNTDYLATYPALGSFLSQHPEVSRSPAYYLERIRAGNEQGYYDTRSESYRIWDEVLSWMGGMAAAILVATSLGWFIRMLVDYRRWYRLSRIQSEAHNKLLDRMTQNEELLAYVQSPAGRRFLESAPISLDPGSRRMGAPFNRILWSVQAGLVLGAGGLGLQWVSGRVNAPDAGQPLYAMGVLALSLGVGFVLSSVVSYALSHRLGLFNGDHAAPKPAGE